MASSAATNPSEKATRFGTQLAGCRRIGKYSTLLVQSKNGGRDLLPPYS